MLKLRPYQDRIINKLRSLLLKGTKKLILCAPTGAGKTAMFTFMASNAEAKGNKTLIITDRIELLTQAGGAITRLNLPYCTLTAETKQLPHNKIVIAMLETLHRRITGKNKAIFENWLHEFKLVIFDEAHKTNGVKILDLLNPEKIVIGATATPYRTGRMIELEKHYTHIVDEVSISELIKLKYLAKPEYYGIPADLSTVGKEQGEFKTSDLTRVFSDKKTFTGLTTNYERLFKGRKSLIFCPSIASAMVIYKELNLAVLVGLKMSLCKCAKKGTILQQGFKRFEPDTIFYVDGNLPQSQREQQLNDFYNTKKGIMINVGVLTTGYDCPTIDTVILYRATTSLPLYLQMVGRGSRVTDTKTTFRIIDFGDNVRRHGFWHDERNWSLKNDKVPKEGTAPVKTCHKCQALIQASIMVCPYCQTVQISKNKTKIIDTKLEKIEVLKVYKPIDMDNFNFKLTGKTISVQDLENMRIAKNYKTGFVLNRLKTLARFQEYATLKGYKSGWAQTNYNYYNGAK